MSEPKDWKVAYLNVCTERDALREALQRMLEDYVELKRISLLRAKKDAPNWIGKDMTPEDDVNVQRARSALGA